MITIQLSPGCTRWQVGDRTQHPPEDATLLKAVTEAGFVAFTGPSGLCGGKSETRSLVAIHRGQGRKWELVFRENEADIVTTRTTDLADATDAILTWLCGKMLDVDENAIHAAAG